VKQRITHFWYIGKTVVKLAFLLQEKEEPLNGTKYMKLLSSDIGQWVPKDFSP
jgi:hypothetical protein